MKPRDCPPTVVKLPPMYMLLPLRASAPTLLFGFGFHAVARPVVTFSAPA